MMDDLFAKRAGPVHSAFGQPHQAASGAHDHVDAHLDKARSAKTHAEKRQHAFRAITALNGMTKKARRAATSNDTPTASTGELGMPGPPV